MFDGLLFLGSCYNSEFLLGNEMAYKCHGLWLEGSTSEGRSRDM